VIDGRVLVFTVLLSLLTGVLFGLAPAIQASRCDLSTALKENNARAGGTVRRSFARSSLLVVEVALATVLLIGADLFIETFIAVRRVDPGFDSRNVLTMKMSLNQTRFQKTAAVTQLVGEGRQRVEGLSGVEIAAASYYLPLIAGPELPFVIEGRTLSGTAHGTEHWRTISPEYFDVFKIPVLRGRPFNGRDQSGAPGVAIINRAMARRYWPQGDPLKDRIVIGKGRGSVLEDPPRQIVGIVGDLRDDGLNHDPRPAMYVPLAQVSDALAAGFARNLPLVWIVRTRADPRSVRDAIQSALSQASGGLPVGNIRTMDEILSQSTARADFSMLLLSIFGGSALLLAAIGIYGLMAYSVRQRSQEIGIRIAIGAEPKDVRRMVVWQGMRLALLGAAIGIAASFGLTRLVESYLFQVHRLDPLAFTTMPLLLFAVTLLSVWLPARRASRVDPAAALRCE